MKITKEELQLKLKLLLTLDFLTKGLNGSDGLIREHYREAARTKKRLTWLLHSQNKDRLKFSKPCKITYTRYTSRMMDWDNACASFKHLGDALQLAGIITDDSPKVLKEFVPLQISCKKIEERMEILIEEI